MADDGARGADPLATLREYRELAPWNLRDLAAVAGAILETSGIRPFNAAATVRPNERTIRFYVTQGIVTPPDGRGTAATYSYRHLLQVLAVKLRQMEGITLARIGTELNETTGDVLERRVAASLGPSLPRPRHLPLSGDERPAFGRTGRALGRSFDTHNEQRPETSRRRGEVAPWHRISISRGLELHVAADHTLMRRSTGPEDVAAAVRHAVARMLGQQPGRDGESSSAGDSSTDRVIDN